MIKTLSKARKQERVKFLIPRSVQDCIPIRRIWADGIFQVGHQFSKTWSFTDINYSIAGKDDKTAMFLDYCDLLNALASGASAKITLYNRRINKEEFERSVLLPLKEDGLDNYREEFNEMLRAQVTESNNSIVRERYLTISVVKRNIEEARTYFARVGTDLTTKLAALSSVAQELSLNERLRIFRDFFRPADPPAAEFDIHQKARRGQHFKDWLCPSSMEFTVAYLNEENVDRLRTVLWDMNELDWRTESQLQEEEQTNEEGETETTTITETVLIIELTHHTPEEMRETYHFTDRQNEYLTLLSGEDTAILWGKLLGGLIQGSDELMAPGMDTVFADGALQWPLPVAGTITSPQGYRTDPLTGKTSYHSGTDIAVPEGTPILAAADGTVTVANALDSWGGSYGYYVKIDHGGGLTTLYAHCSRICVTVGQEVKAGQVIAYVGHTGRATGAHLHFEMRNYD